jgi:hypothetical protein
MVFKGEYQSHQGFQALEKRLMGLVEGGVMGPHRNEWSVHARPDLKWEIPIIAAMN